MLFEHRVRKVNIEVHDVCVYDAAQLLHFSNEKFCLLFLRAIIKCDSVDNMLQQGRFFVDFPRVRTLRS